jgi:hypothetical protein
MATKEMNEVIDKLAYTHGMYCDGTPDSWDSEAIENFAKAIIKECISTMHSIDRSELTKTTFDKSLVEGTLERAEKLIKKKFSLQN